MSAAERDRTSLRGASSRAERLGLTDLGNAERFARDHLGELRYVDPWRKWLLWDGRRWRIAGAGELAEKATETVRGIYAEAAQADGDGDREALARHALASESRKRIDAMIALARGMAAMWVPIDVVGGIPRPLLDRDPWLLNVANGTLDLRTGDLREHRRADHITKLAPVVLDRGAKAPNFEAFLEEILPDESVRRFVQRAIGYATCGVVSEDLLVILHGSGANGKTTLVQAVMDTLGDYAIQAAPDLLLAKKGTHPTELADLFGARFVVCSETGEGRRLAEELVKRLTSRDRIRARRMREDFWEFEPTHTVFLATNHRPEIRGTDHGIWRRIKLIPFEVRIPDSEQDKDLPEKLRAERAGILRWIVEGWLEYQKHGLGEPEKVTEATKGYRAEMDVLAGFIEDRCVEHPKASAGATPLYKAYREWCEENGESPVSQRKFGLQLRERGYQKDTSGTVIWSGIGLRYDGPDDGGQGPGEGDESGPYAGSKPEQDVTYAGPSGDYGPNPGPYAHQGPAGESGLYKPDSLKDAGELGPYGPETYIDAKNLSHVEVMSKKGPQGPQEAPEEGAHRAYREEFR